jgi:hypothetical protein
MGTRTLMRMYATSREEVEGSSKRSSPAATLVIGFVSRIRRSPIAKPSWHPALAIAAAVSSH